MKQALALGLVLLLGASFQTGCGGVGVRLGPSAGSDQRVSSSSSWPDPGWENEEPTLNMTPFIIGAIALAVTAGTALHLQSRRDKARYSLTPEGGSVRLLVHAEAPEDALFLGDLETKALDRLEQVRNDLRNRTARLGGDLAVLDDVQPEIRDGRTWGYIGIGRAYRLKAR